MCYYKKMNNVNSSVNSNMNSNVNSSMNSDTKLFFLCENVYG